MVETAADDRHAEGSPGSPAAACEYVVDPRHPNDGSTAGMFSRWVLRAITTLGNLILGPILIIARIL
jgi:hypothetical protein